jgi:hypothetical protein
MLIGDALAPLHAWRTTRFPLPRFLPLALLLAWPAAAAAADGAVIPFLARVALAFSLLAQFRLWDDLIDRHRDRSRHPERVLARLDRADAFVLAALVLGFVNVAGVTLSSGVRAASALLLLDAAAALWYALQRERTLLHTHVVLFKYPVFVLLLAPAWPPDGPVLLGAGLLYCAMCLFELLDSTPGECPLPPHYALHAALMAATAALASSLLIGAAVSLLLAAIVAQRSGARYARLALPYGPFLALAMSLLTMKGGS